MKKILIAALVAAAALFTSCGQHGPKANLKTDVDTISYEMGMVMAPQEKELAYMLAMQGSDSLYVDEFLKGYQEGMISADDKKKLAYNLGLQAGMQLKMQIPMMEQQIFQGDSTKKVSMKNFIAGFKAFVKGKTAIERDGKFIDKMQANEHIMDYMFSKQRSASEEFMAAKAKEAGVKKLENGVLYKELEKGAGETRCALTDSVEVKYEGILMNGEVFDSSKSMPNGSATLNLTNVIKGWQTAITQMPVGATWEIYIPYDMAYGKDGSGHIPPYSALTFKVTLVKILK